MRPPPPPSPRLRPRLPLPRSRQSGALADLALLVLNAALLVLALAGRGASALRGVRLELPPVVRAGETVVLSCLYDLEGAPLYSVKWYRGNFEFYRVLPREDPSRMAFDYPGIHVDVGKSDEYQVTLHRVPVGLSGTFSCEVSADAPSFSTEVVSGQLHVLDHRKPQLTLSRNAYSVGDVLEANCTSDQKPPDPHHANSPQGGTRAGLIPGDAKFFGKMRPLLPESPPLQAHQLSPAQLAYLQASSGPTTAFAFYVNNALAPFWQVRQTSQTATLRRDLTEEDFFAGKVRVKCVTSIAGMYRETSPVVSALRRHGPDVPDPTPEEHKTQLARLDQEAGPWPTVAAGGLPSRQGPQCFLVLVMSWVAWVAGTRT